MQIQKNACKILYTFISSITWFSCIICFSCSLSTWGISALLLLPFLSSTLSFRVMDSLLLVYLFLLLSLSVFHPLLWTSTLQNCWLPFWMLYQPHLYTLQQHSLFLLITYNRMWWRPTHSICDDTQPIQFAAMLYQHGIANELLNSDYCRYWHTLQWLASTPPHRGAWCTIRNAIA